MTRHVRLRTLRLVASRRRSALVGVARRGPLPAAARRRTGSFDWEVSKHLRRPPDRPTSCRDGATEDALPVWSRSRRRGGASTRRPRARHGPVRGLGRWPPSWLGVVTYYEVTHRGPGGRPSTRTGNGEIIAEVVRRPNTAAWATRPRSTARPGSWSPPSTPRCGWSATARSPRPRHWAGVLPEGAESTALGIPRRPAGRRQGVRAEFLAAGHQRRPTRTSTRAGRTRLEEGPGSVHRDVRRRPTVTVTSSYEGTAVPDRRRGAGFTAVTEPGRHGRLRRPRAGRRPPGDRRLAGPGMKVRRPPSWVSPAQIVDGAFTGDADPTSRRARPVAAATPSTPGRRTATRTPARTPRPR